MSFCVRSIRIFSKFSGDPYYEPLSWFMIKKMWTWLARERNTVANTGVEKHSNLTSTFPQGRTSFFSLTLLYT